MTDLLPSEWVDRQPGDQLEQMVLTAIEVAQILRLCDPTSTPREREAAVSTVHRLVRDGKFKPLRPGRAHVFYRAEIARYIRDETYKSY